MAEKKRPKYSSEQMKRYFNDPAYRQQLLSRGRSFYKRFRYYFLGAFGTFFALMVMYYFYIISGLPSLEELENPKPELATKVYSVDGEILATFYSTKNRSYVTYDQIPQSVIDALVSTEDKNFYEHWGVTPWRFLRAMVKNLLVFRLKEGASTITQQLARNLYGFQRADENVFDKMTRKFREFATSVQIEKNFTKKEILEMYLNEIYFGRSVYGISAASGVYFGKQVDELTLGESVMLVAILNGPAYYDPQRHPERAFARRDLVLALMVQEGRLSREQADKVKAEPLTFSTNEEAPLGLAPHFVEYIRQQMRDKAEKYGFNIYKEGLSVYTTLDSRMQRYANRAVEEHLAEKQQQFNKIWNWGRKSALLEKVLDRTARQTQRYRLAQDKEAAVAAMKNDPSFVDSVKQVWQSIEVGFVAIDPKTGGIRAMVGGRNFRTFRYGLNHVTQIRRQPGSCFKPFVYTVAIDNGYPPCYEMDNQPITIMMDDGKEWRPENFEGDVGGKSTLRMALTRSLNLVTVRVMDLVTKEQVIDYAQRMGIKSPIPPYYSIALGTAQVTPLEMTSAFGVFANEGIYVEPNSILKIEDKDGNVIEENVPEKKEVLSKETAFLMTSMLEDVVNHPQGSGLRIRNFFHYPAAGKTGTTQDYADAWFVGFTPQLAAGMWVGFDDQSVTFNSADGQGGRAAAPLFGRFMKYVYEDKTIPITQPYFRMPNGVERDTICAETKKLATPFCPVKVTEVFNSKYLPAQCDVHLTADSLGNHSPTEF